MWNAIIVNLNIQFRVGPRRNARSKDSSHLSVVRVNLKGKCSVVKKTLSRLALYASWRGDIKETQIGISV